jgi:hypothetical protein
MSSSDCTVFVLTWCRRDESLSGNLFVFDTIRVGFPEAELVVYDNASAERYRDAIRERVSRVGGKFRTIDTEIEHGIFVRQRLMDAQTEQVCFVDPDVVFWEEVQPLPHHALIGGRKLPAFLDPYSRTITWERLHTSLLQVCRLSVLRQLIHRVEDEMFEFDAIQPRMVLRHGVWERYDTAASLYHFLQHTRPETVFEYGERELDRYDHLFCGTHLWDIESENAELGAILREYHDAAHRDVTAIRGLWRKQQTIFDELAKALTPDG